MAAGRAATDALSAREAEVLRAVVQHATNAEIAQRLHLSVRTVESHVAAILRKTGASDRRALIGDAPMLLDGAPSPRRPSGPSTFIGRAVERRSLLAALSEDRLVTVLGSGGVGKTRLVQEVTAGVQEHYRDGVRVVDLVPTTGGGEVLRAVAAALAAQERAERSLRESTVAAVRDRSLLLVLDNCEHVVESVAPLVEELLAATPGLTVLATSRRRLAVPFERVIVLAGLRVAPVNGEPGDAVRLFEARAAAAGASLPPGLRPRVAAVCAALDGQALAIELAAARLPDVGLDGLESGLSEALSLLEGGRRADDRHRSLRAALDWSHALLEPDDQAVLRRSAVFRGDFSADAAVAVTGAQGAPAPMAVRAALGRLAGSSMITVRLRDDGTTRYRLLETVRQYAAQLLEAAEEGEPVRLGHLRWSLRRAEALSDPEASAADFDDVAADLRAALRWARDQQALRPEAHRLASALANAAFLRGLPGEAQRRFEEAAALTDDRVAAGVLLSAAGGAAEVREFGRDVLRLRTEAATAFLEGGKRGAAAAQLARAAEFMYRGAGILSPAPGPEDAMAMLGRARELAGDDPGAAARILIADACWTPPDRPGRADLARRAYEAADAVDDACGRSAALDALWLAEFETGAPAAAEATVRRRLALLRAAPRSPEIDMERADALETAMWSAVAAGDLREADALSRDVLDLPAAAGEQHLSAASRMVVAFLVGEPGACRAAGALFLDAWERAGSPRTGSEAIAAAAAAAACVLLGDEAGARRWRGLADELRLGPDDPTRYGERVLEMLPLLHLGRFEEALACCSAAPEPVDFWFKRVWRPWYAALWAESAVLAGAPDASSRVERARALADGNRVTVALVDRSAALLAGDLDGLPALAAVFDALHAGYQASRTRVLAGGALRALGEDELHRAGVVTMAMPDGPAPRPSTLRRDRAT